MSVDPLSGYAHEGLRFDRLVGRGGMGAVYAGWQDPPGRPVAIKVIAPHLAADAGYRDRFLREARCLARLNHPGIVACYHHGAIPGPDGDAVLVMVLELIAGGTLADRLREDPVPMRVVVGWFADACDALAAAHRQGVVHRDIKPDNLMLTAAGAVKIADFGLARGQDSTQVTATGALLGSPAYMAPEACRGEEPGPAADIYAIGCSLFQALTGQPPFASAGVLQVLQAHQHQSAPRVKDHRPDVAQLDAVVARCLAKHPHQRPADAAQLAAELRRLVSAIPAHALAARARRPTPGQAPATVVTRPMPPAVARGRWRVLAVVGGVVSAVVVVALVLLAVEYRPREVSPEASTTDNINALLDKAELLIAERRGPAAAAALDTLHVWVRDADVTPAQRARWQTLQARIDQGEGGTSGEQALVTRLDGMERLLTDGDAAGAVELLAGLRLPTRAGGLEERRGSLMARAQALLAAQEPALGITVLPVDGAPVPWERVPVQAPAVPRPWVAFQAQGGSYRWTLPAAPGRMLVLLGSDGEAMVTVTLEQGGIQRAVTMLPVDGWIPHVITLPAGAAGTVVLEANSPVVLGGVVRAEHGVPDVRQLEMVAGTLMAVREGSEALSPSLAKVCVWWPDAVPVEDFAARIRQALGAAEDPHIEVYHPRDRDVLARVRAAPEDTTVRIIAVPSGFPAAERAQEVLKTLRELQRSGRPVILVTGMDRDRPVLALAEHRQAWLRLVSNARERGFAGVVDLGQIPAFLARQQQRVDMTPEVYVQHLMRGLEVGLQQWAARTKAHR